VPFLRPSKVSAGREHELLWQKSIILTTKWQVLLHTAYVLQKHSAETSSSIEWNIYLSVLYADEGCTLSYDNINLNIVFQLL